MSNTNVDFSKDYIRIYFLKLFLIGELTNQPADPNGVMHYRRQNGGLGNCTHP
jgi:hypothetical protein